MKPNLAPRARGTLVGEWDIGGAFVAFDGPEWRVKYTTDQGRRADIVLSVIGLQYANGHAFREIIIDCPDTPIITPAEARKLARALVAAADSAEGRLARPQTCESEVPVFVLGDDALADHVRRAGAGEEVVVLIGYLVRGRTHPDLHR
jgi:hypothetical protein